MKKLGGLFHASYELIHISGKHIKFTLFSDLILWLNSIELSVINSHLKIFDKK